MREALTVGRPIQDVSWDPDLHERFHLGLESVSQTSAPTDQRGAKLFLFVPVWLKIYPNFGQLLQLF